MTRLDGSLSDGFLVTAGSVAGNEHLRLNRNNQDGLGIYVDEDLIVAAVTDGCSSGRHSEVGARLGAHWLAAWAPVHWRATRDVSAFVSRLSRGLKAYLSILAHSLDPSSGSLSKIVSEYLLFTFLVAVVGRKRTVVFGVGDGVFSINRRHVVLPAGKDNAPPYLSYSLVDSSSLEEEVGALDPVIHFSAASAEIDSIVIATDGALEIQDRGQFETDPRYLRNPSLLHKQLVVLGRVNRRLGDDTSMVLIRRRRLGPLA